LEALWTRAKAGSNEFKILDGLLYRWIEDNVNAMRKYALVVPAVYCRQLLMLAHDDKTDGHMGVRKTLNDVLGRDLRSKQGNGNKYVLTLSCRSSCWPFTIPVRNVRSKTITDKLSELFCSIGIPKTLVLDSMLSFRSELFAQWARDLDIKLNFSAPNHPISHAHMEKANSVISQRPTTVYNNDRLTAFDPGQPG